MTLGTGLRAFWTATPWGPTRVQPLPANITNFRVTDDHYYSRHILLEWNWIADGDSISLYRDNVLIATLNAGSTQYRDVGLTLDTSYTYRLEASNSAGTVSASLTHLLTTRLPTLRYSQTHYPGSTASYSVPFPAPSEYKPYDAVLVIVTRTGTAAITVSPAEWTLHPAAYSVGTTATTNIYWRRIMPSPTNSSQAEPPSLTISQTAAETTVNVLIMKDVDVLTNQFLYKEPYAPYAPINTAAVAAGSTQSVLNLEGWAPTGTFVNVVSMNSNAATTTPGFNSVSGHQSSTQPPSVAARNHIALQFQEELTPGTSRTFSYSYGVLGSHMVLPLFFSQAATSKMPFSYASGSSTTVGTSIDIVLGTNTPATGDLAVIHVVTGSGTGAITGSWVNAVGWSAPRLVYDSTNTNPGVRVAVIVSYGTALTNAAVSTMRVTYPSNHIIFGAAMLKNVGNFDPVAVSSNSVGPETLTTNLTAPSFLMGIVGEYGQSLSTVNSNLNLPSGPGFTGGGGSVVEQTGVVSGNRNSSIATPPTGYYAQHGVAKTSGVASWTADVPAAITNPSLKVLLSWTTPEIRAGLVEVDAIQAAPTTFAAFGIPL